MNFFIFINKSFRKDNSELNVLHYCINSFIVKLSYYFKKYIFKCKCHALTANLLLGKCIGMFLRIPTIIKLSSIYFI